MFFIFGVAPKPDKLDFNQPVICRQCGRYGSYEAFIEYMYFSLFFIPIFKWNKKYYVRTSCCGSLYTIDAELGSRIAKGDSVTLTEQDLHLAYSGRHQHLKRCANCGYETHEDFQYCPKCANPLS